MNWSLPTLTSLYTDFLTELRGRDDDCAKMFDGTSSENLPTGAVGWNSANSRFEKFNGTAWVNLATSFAIDVATLGGFAVESFRDAGSLSEGTLLGARFNDSSHGNRASGTLHAVATALANGFMSAADKIKLDQITVANLVTVSQMPPFTPAGMFYPRAATPADLTVRVDAGELFVGGAVLQQVPQTVSGFVAPVTNPRIDRVVIDAATGVVTRVAGVEGVSPAAPAIPIGKWPCCQVLMAVGTTAIAGSMITDERTYSAQPAVSTPVALYASQAGLTLSSSGNPVTLTIDFGTVQIGQALCLQAYVNGLKGGTGGVVSVSIIKASGTGNFRSYNSAGSGPRADSYVPANVQVSTAASGVAVVTSAGTLVVTLSANSQTSDMTNTTAFLTGVALPLL